MPAPAYANADTLLQARAQHPNESAQYFRERAQYPQERAQSSLGTVLERQHVYQEALFSCSKALSKVEWTTATFAAGLYRMELQIPSRLRQWRWRARRAVSRFEAVAVPVLGAVRTQRLLRKVLPLILLIGATAACGLVSKEGDKGPLAVGPLPELSKPKPAALPKESPRRDVPWSYVLPVDHGVRSDESGQGHFRAPRFHGEHNGLDLLAPVGTPTFSPCDGEAMAGVSRSFGHWVHIICPVPPAYMKVGGPTPWVSFFYAHLDATELPNNEWAKVARGQEVGQVGKSGNARGPNVQPHLHLELIVQKNHRGAMDERHVGSDQSSVPAADHFADTLSTSCMNPYGFEPKSRLLRRARRIDPFVALTCLSDRKPNYVRAPSPLAESSLAWTSFYVAEDFNVNLGVEDSRTKGR